jgi:hypothetical protein
MGILIKASRGADQRQFAEKNRQIANRQFPRQTGSAWAGGK